MVRSLILRLAALTHDALRARRGNVAILFAITLPVIVGGAGLGVETTYWHYKQLQLQGAADAAAFAGGVEKRMGSAPTTVTASSKQVAIENGFDPAGAIVVSEPTGQPNQVQVVLQENAARFFTGYFSNTPVRLRAQAVAMFNTASSACVLALDPSASRAAQVSGSGNLTLSGCSVMANSLAADAVNVQGSAHLTTPCIISAGGVSLTAGAVLTDPKCPSPIIDAPRAADPYRNLAAPSASGLPVFHNANGSTLQPGVYDNGMNLNGTAHLQPGVYIVQNGDLKINATADIDGTGVTFYLKGTARLTINGTPHVDLTAPSTGPYAGILFYGDRTNVGGTNKVNGDANSRMTGAIYFPSQDVQYNGNFSGLNGCTQVVARTIDWTGNTSVAVDCSAYGLLPIPATTIVKLVA